MEQHKFREVFRRCVCAFWFVNSDTSAKFFWECTIVAVPTGLYVFGCDLWYTVVRTKIPLLETKDPSRSDPQNVVSSLYLSSSLDGDCRSCWSWRRCNQKPEEGEGYQVIKKIKIPNGRMLFTRYHGTICSECPDPGSTYLRKTVPWRRWIQQRSKLDWYIWLHWVPTRRVFYGVFSWKKFRRQGKREEVLCTWISATLVRVQQVSPKRIL